MLFIPFILYTRERGGQFVGSMVNTIDEMSKSVQSCIQSYEPFNVTEAAGVPLHVNVLFSFTL